MSVEGVGEPVAAFAVESTGAAVIQLLSGGAPASHTLADNAIVLTSRQSGTHNFNMVLKIIFLRRGIKLRT